MNRKLNWFAGLMAFSAISAHAVSADEAKTLGTTLTAVGAEKAGNAAGTIPAYSGGLTTAPAGFKTGDGVRPDPFASEKPRLQIDAKNMATHAAQLTEGAKALMQKYRASASTSIRRTARSRSRNSSRTTPPRPRSAPRR